MTRSIHVLLIIVGFALTSPGTGNALAQSSSPAHTRLSLAGPAKRFCSAIWVSGRGRNEALSNSVRLADNATGRGERNEETRFSVDEAKRIVSATRDGVVARARYFGDQGCVILPAGMDQVFFTPRKVVSDLPEASSLPWPMGDRLSDEPLPDHVNKELLDEAVATLFRESLDRRAAFVVVHQGRIVAEHYGSGAHRDMQLESWSMGKSMTATFAGRLMQMGHLGLWDPAPIPEWQNTPRDPRAQIRVADLLRMSSGLRFSGGGSSPAQMAASHVPGFPDHGLGYSAPIDIFRFSASRDAEYPPNTVGRYRNSDPWTLGYVVRRTVEGLGEEYLTWPQRRLFDQIGIRRFVMETDPYGNFILTGYNYGTARHWARLGMLYLQEGMWNGERLLPRHFVEFVRTPAPAWDQPVYGGLFWTNNAERGSDRRRHVTLPLDTYYASGAGGQHTYIIPSRDLVIVVMSHRHGQTLSPDRDSRMFEALGLVVRAVDSSWSWQ